MGIDAGRGQAYGPHVPHQRARRQGRGAPAAHGLHQTVAHHQHGIVYALQGGKKARAARWFLPGQGQQAFGADGKHGAVACIPIGCDAIGQRLRW